jgi:hypothetical protein
MTFNPGWRSGRWQAICDVCGFKFHSDRMRKRWDGLFVCEKDWETRNPQDFLKLHAERITPPWTRPESGDVFVNVCYIWERASYADLGTADCMVVGNTAQPYLFLLGLRDPAAAE